MAAIFTSGSKSGLANAAALGQAVAEQFRDDLVAHTAWELVEEVTPGTVHWYVFRCLASESGLPVDFYIVMGRVIATGKLHWCICEGYDDTTNVMSLYPTNSGSGNTGTATYTFDANGRQTSHTFTLSTSIWTSGANQPRYFEYTPTATSTNWWLIVREDFFVFTLDGTVDCNVAAGAYEWRGVPANTCPLMLCGTNAATGQLCYITRNPLAASATFGTHALTTEGPPFIPILDEAYIGWPASPNHAIVGDAMQGGEASCSEIAVILNSNGSSTSHVNSANVIGEFLGVYKYMRFFRQPTSAAFGDGYDIDGRIWVPSVYGTTNELAGLVHDTGVPV